VIPRPCCGCPWLTTIPHSCENHDWAMTGQQPCVHVLYPSVPTRQATQPHGMYYSYMWAAKARVLQIILILMCKGSPICFICSLMLRWCKVYFKLLLCIGLVGDDLLSWRSKKQNYCCSIHIKRVIYLNDVRIICGLIWLSIMLTELLSNYPSIIEPIVIGPFVSSVPSAKCVVPHVLPPS
jgi:hypothetical protein